jgi:hypothetical protein
MDDRPRRETAGGRAAEGLGRRHHPEARLQHPLVHREQRDQLTAETGQDLSRHEGTRLTVCPPELAPIRRLVAAAGRLGVDEPMQAPLLEHHEARPLEDRPVYEPVSGIVRHVVDVHVGLGHGGGLLADEIDPRLAGQQRRERRRPALIQVRAPQGEPHRIDSVSRSTTRSQVMGATRRRPSSPISRSRASGSA